MPDLKVSGAYGYRPYREVEKTTPYTGIDAQQPQEKYPQTPLNERDAGSGQPRRRFRAMRRLIDLLKKDYRIERVDYQTAATELCNIGVQLAEQELAQQFVADGLTERQLEPLFARMRQLLEQPLFRSGANLTPANNFLPVFSSGLHLALLCFDGFSIAHLKDQYLDLVDAAESRIYIREKNRIGLEIYHDEGQGADLLLNVHLVVAVCELDEEQRRVFLYQRADESFALYADKYIDFSV